MQGKGLRASRGEDHRRGGNLKSQSARGGREKSCWWGVLEERKRLERTVTDFVGGDLERAIPT